MVLELLDPRHRALDLLPAVNHLGSIRAFIKQIVYHDT